MKFKSFFMAGFECATGYNSGREWIDQISATQHDLRLDEDYVLMTQIGMRTAREGIRWPLIDRGGVLDLQPVVKVLEAANRAQVELILDLFHYGYPPDLDFFSPAFGDRFERYCEAVAQTVKRVARTPIHFTPVNEPSYYAWAGGEAARFAPFCHGRAFEMKVALISAAIRGINAIRSVIPGARIINVDPICRVAAPEGDDSRDEDVQFFNDVAVFECWDMLAGRIHPELGGSPAHLDVVGINYYWTNQWEIDRPEEPLAMDDERLWPVRDLVRSVWHRYRHPMIISETSHVEHERAPWLRYMVDEIEAVRLEGIPLNGVCIYPILGMPEWHEQDIWVRMGMWDCIANEEGDLERVPHEPLFTEYHDATRRFKLLEQVHLC